MRKITYFDALSGAYRGTVNYFEPSDFPGGALHGDGVSIVKADGSVLRQSPSPAGAVAVDGEFTMRERRDPGTGEIERLPPPPPPKSDAEKLLDALAAEGAIDPAKVEAIRARLVT